METAKRFTCRPSDQFERAYCAGKVAYRAYMAVWINRGNHIAISAPTLNDLEKAWMQIVDCQLVAENAQEVLITSARVKAKGE